MTEKRRAEERTQKREIAKFRHYYKPIQTAFQSKTVRLHRVHQTAEWTQPFVKRSSANVLVSAPLYLQPLDTLTKGCSPSRRVSESQGRSVCPCLSIKPPLVATWLGGSGSTFVDVDRR